MTYEQKLLETKKYYPFDNWREAYNEGLEQYTQENCDETKDVFDSLLAQLININEHAPVDEKIALFKAAVMALNNLNEKIDGLIETGEREDLCELIDQITIASGLIPGDYADGAGIADEWRDW